MLAQVNATLLKVERTEGTVEGGYSEDYDRPATDPEAESSEGGDLWNGSADAYYIERRQRVSVAAGRNLVRSRTLILQNDLPPIDFAEGDTVTWLFNSNTESGQVLVVEAHRANGVEPVVRLSLEDA